MKNLNEALLCFQGKSVSVHKNAKADRYKYADLAAVMDAVIEPLTACGLVLRQRTVFDRAAEATVLVTSLIHVASGESETQEIPLFIDEKPQTFGSRLTYFRRYSILTLLGLAPEDDDGQAAMPQSGYEQRPAQDRRPAYQEQDDGGDLGECADCGAPKRLYKNGKPGCSKYCWKDRAPEQPRQPARRTPARSDDRYDENGVPF